MPKDKRAQSPIDSVVNQALTFVFDPVRDTERIDIIHNGKKPKLLSNIFDILKSEFNVKISYRVVEKTSYEHEKTAYEVDLTSISLSTDKGYMKRIRGRMGEISEFLEDPSKDRKETFRRY